MSLRFCILAVSDTCFQEREEPPAVEQLKETLANSRNCKVLFTKVVPHDFSRIRDVLNEWVLNCDVILTTGGTDMSPTHVTPNVTRSIWDQEATGFTYVVLKRCVEESFKGALCRAVSGVKGRTLIINLPSQAWIASACLNDVLPAIPYALASLKRQKFNEDGSPVSPMVMRRSSAGNFSTPSKSPMTPTSLRSPMTPTSSKSPKTLTFSKSPKTPSSTRSQGTSNTETPRTGAHSTSPRSLPNVSKSPRKPSDVVDTTRAAQIIIKECTPTMEIESVPIEEALHRVLAENISQGDPQIPFYVSTKDGYAVIALDGQTPRKIKKTAPEEDLIIENGETIRLNKGSVVPLRADAIVPLEDTVLDKVTVDNREEIRLSVLTIPMLEQNIKFVGCKQVWFSENNTALKKCRRLNATDLGFLASKKKSFVEVFKQPSVGLIVLENEIPNQHRLHSKAGQIFLSNKPLLTSLLENNHIEYQYYGIMENHHSCLTMQIQMDRAFADNDVVVLFDGLLMGEATFRTILINQFKATIHFDNVNLKSGNPLFFATLLHHGKKKLAFCLPGTPVSAAKTFLIFVIPALKYLEHNDFYTFPVVLACLKNDIKNNNYKCPEYVNVEVKATGKGEIVAYHVTSNLNNLLNSNGLLHVPANSFWKSGTRLFVTLFQPIHPVHPCF